MNEQMEDEYNQMIFNVERLSAILNVQNLSEENKAAINELISGHIMVFKTAMEQHVNNKV